MRDKVIFRILCILFGKPEFDEFNMVWHFRNGYELKEEEQACPFYFASKK